MGFSDLKKSGIGAGLGAATGFFANSIFGKGDKNNVAGKHAAYDAGPLGSYTGGDPIPSTSGAPLPDDPTGRYFPIFDAYKSLFGRNPTAQELAQALPAMDTGDPNFGNIKGVQSYVAQLASNYQNDPAQIAARQQKQYLAEAPKQYDAVNQVFQSNLGRTATQDELDHFGSLLASGNTDPYQLQTFLQQQPEYQTTQNKKFQTDLSGQLAGYDKQYFDQSILPSIQEAYAKQGRSFDSSAFQNAATNSAQQQNVQRQQYIAGISAQQYGGVEQNAYNDYANQVANQQNLTNAGINAQYAGVQQGLNRSQNLQDFNTQNQLYNQYLAKYGNRNNGMGGAIGGLAGAGLGAYFGGPAGAQIGAGLGSSLGTAAQNSNAGSY